MGGARFVADTTAGIAGAKGNSTASVLVADIPDLLRKGSLDALGGQLDFSRDAPASGSRGVEIPPKVNDMGHYVLTGVVDFGGSRANRNRDPSFSASMAEWACSRRRANLSNGGIPLPSAGGRRETFHPAPDVFGLRGGGSWECTRWRSPGSGQDSYDTACEAGTRVGSAAQARIGQKQMG